MGARKRGKGKSGQRMLWVYAVWRAWVGLNMGYVGLGPESARTARRFVKAFDGRLSLCPADFQILNTSSRIESSISKDNAIILVFLWAHRARRPRASASKQANKQHRSRSMLFVRQSLNILRAIEVRVVSYTRQRELGSPRIRSDQILLDRPGSRTVVLRRPRQSLTVCRLRNRDGASRLVDHKCST
ncbi:hypothetical protein BU24DRAFT_142222 [Aaosphaeria arxii CBS 175.79]|uniref:Uncharacterized protein n=1 Tax=Aaosphaeria arxii CBS 175.79 TaxID=1450172 RepID=A0A6A5XUJ0_9PLEO|nr:uncharacterized protein BU24DRAFT_142222 [Aaosphaeria arxii CBS 175.79]KAF2017025.1 hypothetical protein BU24DRAFT_142222 [Aaosphaeria arxii CBS 175.79]